MVFCGISYWHKITTDNNLFLGRSAQKASKTQALTLTIDFCAFTNTYAKRSSYTKRMTTDFLVKSNHYNNQRIKIGLNK